MRLSTFAKKLYDINFHYASFKHCGWSGDNKDDIKKDINYFLDNGISGIVEVTFLEKSDIMKQKQREIEYKKEQAKQKMLARKFKFSFGYKVIVPNNLTINIYHYAIDKKNKILRFTIWNNPDYREITDKELQEHYEKYLKIKGTNQ